MYTSLHNHTDYSNLRIIDSINSVEKLIDRAYELGLKGVAITDHETVSGHIKAIDYYNKKYKDKKDEFKLILGNEIYLTRSDLNGETHKKGEKFFHMVLLAKDEIGHRQLRELSTRAWNRSYFRNMMRCPTYQEDLVEVVGANPGHLVATTACLGGYTGSMFLNHQFHMIDGFLDFMERVFGKENFFIELQPSFQDDQINYNKFMLEHYMNNYNFIFTTDSHYLKKEDRKYHRWFLQSKSGEREVDSFYSSAYMMGYDEIKKYFQDYISIETLDKMKDNTNKIGNMVQDYELGHVQIVPKIVYEYNKLDLEKIKTIHDLFVANNVEKYPYLTYYLTTKDEADSYYIQLILQGYYDLIYGTEGKDVEVTSPDEDNKSTVNITLEERMDRLNYELEQVREISIKLEQSLSNYFITMAKMIELVWDEGDSIVGVSRGSAAAFLSNYLVGITQIDPQTQPLELPAWRFLHKDRPELPDVDFDTESTKRTKIFNKFQEYFNSINAGVVNVCTFGTMGSKKAIQTAARGLDLDDSIVAYLNSMIPNERGFDLSLTQCYFGDDDHSPIKAFVEEMDKNPDLWNLSCAIEGLISQLGVHASGILVVNGDIVDHNSVMKTSKGILVSAFDLGDSEKMGGLKYDALTVQALDKIRATLNYLLEDGVIEWEGSLRKTYDKYLLPKNLDYTSPEMWAKLGNGDIIDVFQFDTMVGSQAVRLIQPQNIAELAVANSVMRLMAQEGMELPLDTYVKHKSDLDIWYREMDIFKLNPDEVKTLEKYLKPLYGVADSQESIMMITMDPKISGFTVPEANLLRKAIAKKKADVLEQSKTLFYEKGRSLNTREEMLDYVWNLQIYRQQGYSFSVVHTIGYSTIALQEMNLAYHYPDIYWKCACLSVNAGAINEEDYYNLVDEGVIELSDEDDKRTQSKVQYGKIASAISMFKQQNIRIDMPDINKSRMGFTPDAENNSILYGIKGITKVGENVIQEIILNRDFESLEDFVNKMVTSDGKKLISKDRVINLIKAGAFDRLENKPREEILRNFIESIADQKKRITLQNFAMLIKKNFVPEYLDEEKKCYNFTKYIRKFRNQDRTAYILDKIAQQYFFERFPKEKANYDGDTVYINSNWWDKVYNGFMDNVRKWMKAHHDQILKTLNEDLFNEEFNKYAKGDRLDWELQSLNFFYSGHPLANIGPQLPIEITPLDFIEEGMIVGYWNFNGKSIPQLKLSTIIGTVIDKDKVKSTVTLSTPEGVVTVKMYKQQYAKFVHETKVDEDDENYVSNEENFFEKGSHLAITGIKRGDVFVPKTYKKTGIDQIMKIVVDENRNFVEFRRKD